MISSALRLFARDGYAGTSVAEIEREAGLSPGSGGLYKHFRSKQELLAAGIRARIGAPEDVTPLLAELRGRADTSEVIRRVAEAGLRRLGAEADLNRILLRDLAAFPDLLTEFRDTELRRLHAQLAEALRRLTPGAGDPEAVAAVAVAAVSHHWTLCDLFGEDPLRIGTDRFLDALTAMVAGVMKQHPGGTT